MDCLFRSIIPARVYPFTAFSVLPGSVDLRNNGFSEVVRVLNMHPVSNLPQLTIMQDAVRHWYATFLHDELGIVLLLLLLCHPPRLFLQVHGVFVDLAILFVILLRILKHKLDILHEMIHRVVLLTLQLSLQNIHGHGALYFGMIFGHHCLVWNTLECRDHELILRVSRLTDGLHDGLDPSFHRCINPRWPSALLAGLGVLFCIVL